MALKTDEDLFTESTMTFGEHLEELRVCLFRAIIGLVIGTVIGLYFGDAVVAMIEHPLRNALKEYYKTAAEKEYKEWAYAQYDAGKPIPYTVDEVRAIAKGDPDRGLPELIYELEFVHPETFATSLGLARTEPAAPAATATPTATPSPTAAATATPTATSTGTGTTTELSPENILTPEQVRTRAIEGVPNATPRYSRGNLVAHLLWHPIESDGRFNMQATGVTEPFTVWLKAAIVVGLLISSPWVFYQLWTFVAAGLYPHERKYVYMYLPFSLALFLSGAALAYLFVFEPVLQFLFGFNKSLGIDPDPKINEWLGFVLILPLGFGISFQLPLVMLFLARIGIFTLEDYISKWRISVLMIFIISAVLTPADPYSIFFMAVPLTVLYFGGLLLVKYLPQHTPSPRRA